MSKDKLWEDRIKFVDNMMKELAASEVSYKLKFGPKNVKKVEREPFRGLDSSVIPYDKEPQPDKEPQKNRKSEPAIKFSEWYGHIAEKMVVDTGSSILSREHITNGDMWTGQDIWTAWKRGHASLRAITDPGFQFTEESIMCTEVHFITELYRHAGPDGDPKIDLAMMKALLHAGRMIERMRAEGYQKSDAQSKRGSALKRNRYDDGEILNAFNKCHAKNMNDMAVEIDAFLTKHKKQTGDKRNVSSKSTILRVLRKQEGLKDQLPK